MKSLKEKINEILKADFDVHHIFKDIVSEQSTFTEDEEIVDLVFVKRKHVDDRDSNSAVQSPAKLILATTHGLVFAEEGFKEITENYYGYRIKHIYYDKITSLELDICLLQGEFNVVANSTEDPEILIEFNTGIYHQDFEKFIEIVRKSQIKYKD